MLRGSFKQSKKMVDTQDPSCVDIRTQDSVMGLRFRIHRFSHLHRSLFVSVVMLATLAVVVVGNASDVSVQLPGRLELVHPRVVVLKSARKLHLFDGSVLIRTYDIALGFAPVGQKVVEGDGCTPLGRFRICTKNPDSGYHRFLGINYPDPAAANRAHRDGLISLGERSSIVAAHKNNRCPVWSSALGGGIGLHGSGTATDWTAGCIALDDRDVEELFDVLRLGDSVEILP